MRNSLFNKRIPTLFALILIIIGIEILSLLVQHRLFYFSNANPSEVPKDVRITNIFDTSFTVTYTTDATVIGSVSYGKDKNVSQIALDERDQLSGVPTTHTAHSITIRNLDQKTPYYFVIHSGSSSYNNGNNAYQVTTGPTIDSPPTSQNPLTGKVILPTGDVATETIVYVQTADSQVLSTLVKPDGSYALPLNALRTNDLTKYISFVQNTILQLLVADASRISHALIAANQSNVPLITLSNDYDFTTSETSIASSTGQLANLFPVIPAIESSQIPDITNPKDTAFLTDAQPEFQGTAQPETNVTIIIEPLSHIHTSVISDARGFWSFRPNERLVSGKETISITAKNTSGLSQTIEHSFTILEAGTQVDQSATPSATPVATDTPFPTDTPEPTITTPTLTPAISFTPTPTLQATPTQIVVLFPTATPTPIVLTTNTPVPTNPPLPPTGNSSIIFVGLTGIITTIFGLALFLITHGAAL